MKKKRILGIIIIFIVAIIAMFLFTSCAHQGGELYVVDDPYNFIGGFWHGFIILFSFIGSWFNSDIVLYSANNVGFWYNFGYILGLSVWFGIAKST